MITENYVSFEVAKMLSPYFSADNTTYFYNEDGELLPWEGNAGNAYEYYPAPTQSLAMKWLREVHNKHIYTVPAVTDDDGVMGYWWADYIITNRRYNSVRTGKLYNSPEEAYEAALKYCIENLI